MKHTPGPWRLDFDPKRNCTVPIREETIANHMVAEVWPIDSKINRLTDDPMCMANARLIAAAPDLLAAVKAAYEELHGYADAGESCVAMHICDQLKAAIAKAEGR